MRVPIRSKLAVLLIAVAVIPLAVALMVLVVQGRQVHTNLIGQSYQSVAGAGATSIRVSLLADMEKALLELQDDPHAPEELAAYNKALSPLELDELDAIWDKGDKKDSRVSKVLDNHTSEHLRTLIANMPEIAEIFVTDRFGQLVASSQMTTDFYQADELWWQQAFKDGKGCVFVPPVSYDDSAEVWSIDICVPLFLDDRIVGVAKIVLKLTDWIRNSGAFPKTTTAQGMLVEKDGYVIYPLRRRAPRRQLLDWADISRMNEAGWRLTSDKMVQAYAPVALPDQLRGLPVLAPQWMLVLQVPRSLVLAKINRLTRWAIALGSGVIVMIFIVGLYLVDRSIGVRVRRLELAAEQVAGGDLSHRVDTKRWIRHVMGRDELDDLADEFNRMVDGVETSHRELEEANEMKTNFIKVAGHELRTPVSYILTLPKLMADTDDVEKLKGGMAMMEAKAQRLNDIIQAMFKLMPAKEYSDYLNLADVNLTDVLEDVYNDVQPFIEERHQTLVIEPSGDLPIITADPGKIRDVIENLVGNAIKFTPDGGMIHVTAGRQLGEMVVITVVDQGRGIPAEDIENIFNPFFSTGNIMRHSSGAIGYQKRGMGLGLAVVKHFTEMHGGTVHVTSEDTGSTFVVTLPIKPPRPDDAEGNKA
ncbi:hypothetical protein LCGC14_0095020 [marine sediment metagenome]|uniref:histidine kinase n=1 Tax=marine sediment metagenome TaxID=412755 RepID=A0A0F9VHM3_9ZZZZ|nr:HAMP domain-containing histidine kinase [Phycisphaerae bacterium]